jgi:hypothetical protein
MIVDTYGIQHELVDDVHLHAIKKASVRSVSQKQAGLLMSLCLLLALAIERETDAVAYQVSLEGNIAGTL